jgi:hypothetical protein
MVNLRRETGAFFTFLLFGFTCTLTMSMILRTIGQTSRTVHQALTPAAIFILALVIYTGFVLPTPDMQGWLRWVRYQHFFFGNLYVRTCCPVLTQGTAKLLGSYCLRLRKPVDQRVCRPPICVHTVFARRSQLPESDGDAASLRYIGRCSWYRFHRRRLLHKR